jgi:hypothetical protein
MRQINYATTIFRQLFWQWVEIVNNLPMCKTISKMRSMSISMCKSNKQKQKDIFLTAKKYYLDMFLFH